ncbi:hypothetical protein BFG52_11910 [Acinetobacter larvae]|uniref:Fimbrial protein n=1 Tax=Acinetobacter larvae TaxID=1789224 RepID=A0A1B2M453_9GAMM|nr:hypothetical protein BFG52_11910 [Acinetobacter larvae]
MLSSSFVYADDYFNPSLLLNTEGSVVADLSSFESGFQMPGNYKVNVYVNDDFVLSKDLNFQKTDKSDAVSGGLAPCINVEFLTLVGVKYYELPNYEELKNETCIDVKQYIPEAEIVYNFALQRLDLSIPQIWIKSDARGYIPPSEWDRGITAATLNYNFNGSHSDNSNSQFLLLDFGLNVAGFRIKNLSSYNYYHHKPSDTSTSKWSNIQTYAERTIVPLKSELILGDSNTHDNIFDSVGFRGVRLYSSEAMLPISMQGYAPVVRGIASSKSIVTIKQNGYTVYQTNVNAGPFVIDDLSSMSNSGDLHVSVESMSGEVQNFVVPYSGVPVLLREGRSKFDVTAGEFRSGNREQNKPVFVQASMSRGMPQGFTLYGGTQLASKYQAGLLGFGKNMGNWGALSFDMTHANSTLADDKDYKGQSYRLLYSKSLNQLGTTFQLLGYRYSTKGFYTLNDVAYKNMERFELDEKFDEMGNSYYDPSSYYNLNFTKKGRFLFNVTQDLRDYGSLYASINYQTYWNAPKSTKTYQVGYAKAFKNFSYNLAWSLQDSYNLVNDKNNTVSASISIPLNAFFGSKDRVKNDIYSNTNYVHDSNGGSSIQTSINGNLLDDRQLSYNVVHGHHDENGAFGTAAVRLDTRYGSGGLGFNFTDDGKNKSLNYDLSGGVILHRGGITLGQSLGDTNVLIDTNGAANVKIENSNNVYTNRKGYAILPYAENYRLNRVALVADSFNDKTEIDVNVKNLVPMRGAVVKAVFDSRIGQRALITLKHNGSYVPYASSVTEQNSNINGMVGTDGQAYLSGLGQKGTLQVSWGADATDSCIASYEFDQEEYESSIANLELNCI